MLLGSFLYDYSSQHANISRYYASCGLMPAVALCLLWPYACCGLMPAVALCQLWPAPAGYCHAPLCQHWVASLSHHSCSQTVFHTYPLHMLRLRRSTCHWSDRLWCFVRPMRIRSRKKIVQHHQERSGLWCCYSYQTQCPNHWQWRSKPFHCWVCPVGHMALCMCVRECVRVYVSVHMWCVHVCAGETCGCMYSIGVCICHCKEKQITHH